MSRGSEGWVVVVGFGAGRWGVGRWVLEAEVDVVEMVGGAVEVGVGGLCCGCGWWACCALADSAIWVGETWGGGAPFTIWSSLASEAIAVSRYMVEGGDLGVFVRTAERARG